MNFNNLIKNVLYNKLLNTDCQTTYNLIVGSRHMKFGTGIPYITTKKIFENSSSSLSLLEDESFYDLMIHGIFGEDARCNNITNLYITVHKRIGYTEKVGEREVEQRREYSSSIRIYFEPLNTNPM